MNTLEVNRYTQAWRDLGAALPRPRAIHAGAAINYHLDLGARLAPLRDRGVFIVASGNVVHNLRRIAWSHGDRGFDWGERFDSFVRELMTARPAALAEVERHPDYALAVPTAEHSLPLAYLAGLCSAAGEPAAPFAVGCALGSLSMASYLLGMSPPPPRAADRVRGNAMPEHTPPEQTNI
jgi:4,5-DOPA dioxygenase extradiol